MTEPVSRENVVGEVIEAQERFRGDRAERQAAGTLVARPVRVLDARTGAQLGLAARLRRVGAGLARAARATGQATVAGYDRTQRTLRHPVTRAVGAGVWGATGGAAARVARFYLATDELERSGRSERQSQVQVKRAVGTGAAAVLAGPGTWLVELLAAGHCEFLTLQYGPWAAVLAAAGYGIKRGRDKLAALRAAEQAVTDEQGRTLPIRPLAEARTEAQAMEYLRRALLIEKITSEPVACTRRPWGWELTVRLLDATPDELRKKLARLEMRLDIGAARLLAAPHPDRRARVTLRALLTDPWADMPPIPEYEPTRSITDRIALAVRLDAVQLGASFAGGTHAVLLGASGSGKSILLRTIVDGLGACRDVVLVDCDPTGVGQAPQRDLFSLVALSPEDCTTVLVHLVRLAKARTRLLRRYGWDEWQPSPARPAVVVVIDEFPQLDKAGKAAAIKLLRIARKAGISLVFASQSNTSDALGQAISGQVAFKAAGAGLQRWELALLWGEQAVADGWDTTQLRPKKGTALNDTGTWLFEGCQEGDEALYARGYYLTNEAARARAAHYLSVPRATWDAESLAWAGLAAEELTGCLTDEDSAEAAAQAAAHFAPDPEGDQPERIEEIPQVLLDVAAILEDHEHGLMATKDLADRLEGYTAAELGMALRAAGVPRYGKTGKGRPPGYDNSVPVWDLDAIRATLAAYQDDEEDTTHAA